MRGPLSPGDHAKQCRLEGSIMLYPGQPPAITLDGQPFDIAALGRRQAWQRSTGLRAPHRPEPTHGVDAGTGLRSALRSLQQHTDAKWLERVMRATQ